MRKKHLYPAGFLLLICMAACNGTGTTSTSDSTTTTSMNPGDSSVTTTTTIVHHRYTGQFVPKPNTTYMDLRTHKQINVRIDTDKGIVNSETDEPVDLFVEPITHDTIYGQTGTVVNNYIIRDDSGNVRVDTLRINTVETQTVTADPVAANTDGKYKDKENKSKYKDADEKVKEKTGSLKQKTDRKWKGFF